MVSVSYINPLSEEGKEIARELGDLNRILDENSQLIQAVIQSKHQEISDDSYIPKNYVDLAVKRIEWHVRKRNDPEYKSNKNRYSFLFNEGISKFDVVSFYLLCQAIGIKFGPNSRESKLMIESQGKIMEDRLEELPRYERKEIVGQILNNIIIDERIKWTFLEDLLSSRKINLMDLILSNGELILDKADFIKRFSDRIELRDPEKMYNLVIGERIKELIMIKMIMQETEDYISQVHDMSRNIEPHPSLIEIGDRISDVLQEQTQYYPRFEGEVTASTLNPNAFPPCIKLILEGVGSGKRNDAIVLILTSFLSYARLYPSIFSQNMTVKVSDADPDLKIIQNEILPLIYEAAGNCNPPLFDDQPQEKLNITAKLGFGLHETPNLKHEGESKWYTPMSCEKIKIHLSTLCKPDEACKKIGNPLSYYTRRMSEVKSKNKPKK
ncbi:MAG: DNA primase [Euryarchaeota archaeon]|nr:DNA primase [Euryarchaeota archaeon]